jgi:AraC-like DNA-binding protein
MHDSTVSLWHTDDLSYAEYSRARHRTFAFEPHVHDTVCLALILGGALRLTIGRHTETVRKGAFILIDAGDVHAGHGASSEGWVMRTIHVAPADFAEKMAAAGIAPRIGLRSGVYRDARLSRLFFGIHACAQINDDRLKRDEHLVRLTRRLVVSSDAPAAVAESRCMGAAEAERARDYIEDNVFEPIRLDELARIVALPPYAVVRAFERRFGLSPHRYHVQRRVDLARKLIRERVPLADLSHYCGFADQAHFTRTFKRVLGYTPGFYVRAVRSLQ